MLILSLVALIGGSFGQKGVLGEAVFVRKRSWGILFWSERGTGGCCFGQKGVLWEAVLVKCWIRTCLWRFVEGPWGSCFGQKEVLEDAVLVKWWIRTCLCRFGEGPWWVEVVSVRVPGVSKCHPYVQVQVW